MNASEIAETLVNGNIAQARQEILSSEFRGDRVRRGGYDAATMALDVVSELAPMLDHYSDGENYAAALVRVRRCLEGAG